MENVEKLKAEYQMVLQERVKLEIERYKLLYSNEKFEMPEILISHNFKEDVINTYKECHYPDTYIAMVERKCHWESTVALTIFEYNFNAPPKVIVNAFRWRDDTILHELTHVSDYYSYLQRHDYPDLNYIDSLKRKEFIGVHLLSEFRAFYRGALLSKEDLKQRIIFETREFEKNQERTITDQNLEAYYYHSVKYVGYYCAYCQKYCTEDQIREELNHEDINIIHTLIKFLFPLRDKTFEELENCFNDFQRLLDSMVS